MAICILAVIIFPNVQLIVLLMPSYVSFYIFSRAFLDNKTMRDICHSFGIRHLQMMIWHALASINYVSTPLKHFNHYTFWTCFVCFLFFVWRHESGEYRVFVPTCPENVKESNVLTLKCNPSGYRARHWKICCFRGIRTYDLSLDKWARHCCQFYWAGSRTWYTAVLYTVHV